MNYIHPDQDTDQWNDPENMVIKLRVPWNKGNYWLAECLLTFQERLVPWISYHDLGCNIQKNES
jgi:hypothetical protein